MRRVAALQSNTPVAITMGPVINRPLRCVFAYEGASRETILDELVKPENVGVLDVVCVLNSGSLIHKGILLTWESPQDWLRVNGRAAALGMLYYILVGYASSVLSRCISIDPYFDPIAAWSDQ